MQFYSNIPIRLACAAGGLLACVLGASPAKAMPTGFTDASFITVAAGQEIQFKFDGFSAADTDLMRLVFNGQVIFNNQTATIGQTVTTGPLAAGSYQLSLTNATSGVTYSSNPA